MLKQKNYRKGFIPHHKSGAGFTLIELLVVIAIIGLLASVVLVSLNSARGKSRDAKRLADIKQTQTALELYYDANNNYPTITDNECGGTEGYTVANNNFMQSLVTAGYLSSYPVEPSKINCGVQYSPTGDRQGYVIFYKLENSPASGCNPTQGNHASGWSCVGVNMNPSW